MKKRYFCSILFSLLCSAHAAFAETAKPAAADEAIDYCRAFADKAREARFANQERQLDTLKSDIEAQLVELDARTKELRGWVEKRERIKATISENLVRLYTNVEPETAAAQLQKLDVSQVSALLQQLNPKIAGEIMSVMEPDFASKLTQSMLANARKPKKEIDQP